MYIKRYTIASLLLMIIIGWYVYAFVTQSSYAIVFFGVPLPQMPIAFLSVFPLIILYFASVTHMLYYSLIGSFKLRKFQRDYDKLIEAIKSSFLSKPLSFEYKTDRYKLLGKLIANSKITPKKDFKDSGDEKVDLVLNTLADLNNGKSVELKKLNISSDNALNELNTKNLYGEGKINPEEILSKSQNYASSLIKKAFEDFVVDIPLYVIEKYSEFMSKTSLVTILKRVNADENRLEISNETLAVFMSKVTLSSKEYIDMSIILSAHMIPDQRMKLFELLAENDDNVSDAYIFTLLDLEMVALAKEILDNSQEDEFINFKAYLDLKEKSKVYPLEIFIK